jgi:UDP-2-acetamido-2-deoxy-ribo-hexuluronate aminotransferase
MKKINFIDLQAQYQQYKLEIDSAIHKILDTSAYIMGEKVKTLEENLSKYTGAPYALTCSSGTDALLLALMAIDVQPGDEIITTPFTFIATGESISLLGAKPIFVDIEEDTYNLDVKKVEASITNKTKAIIPVSLYGQPADMKEFNALGKKYIIVIIEDAAQSFGAIYNNNKSCNLSTIACTSFYPAKPLGCYGDGGAIFTQDEFLANKINSLRVHGQKETYLHQYIGINARFDAIQAAVVDVKLKHFEKEVSLRQKIANNYTKKFLDSKIIPPIVKKDRTSVYAQYSIRVKNRTKVIEDLKKDSIPTAIHYGLPLHLQPVYKNLGYKQGDFPVTELIAQEIMSLPMHSFLEEEQQDYIIEKLLQHTA